MLVHLDRLVVDDIQVRIEALGQALCQFFLDRDRFVWIAVDCTLQLLQAIRQVGPLASALKRGQNLR